MHTDQAAGHTPSCGGVDINSRFLLGGATKTAVVLLLTAQIFTQKRENTNAGKHNLGLCCCSFTLLLLHFLRTSLTRKLRRCCHQRRDKPAAAAAAAHCGCARAAINPPRFLDDCCAPWKLLYCCQRARRLRSEGVYGPAARPISLESLTEVQSN